MSSTSLVAYLALFATVAFLFLLVALLLGRLLRPHAPSLQKQEPYECGEPPVGTSFVQFDLRFYVVALVFIIFEVEVALFFPAATIFGKAAQLMNPHVSQETASSLRGELGFPLEFQAPGGDAGQAAIAADARTLALASMADLGVFFAVILVAFAYVWWQGDLNWVRAIGQQKFRAQSPEIRVST